MRRIPFRQVCEEILGLAGQPYDTGLTTQLGILVGFLNARVQEGWEYRDWPEWTLFETRAFADDWQDDLTYDADEIVYVASAATYYEAQTSVPAGTDPTTDDGTYWAEYTRTHSEIDYEQYGETKIGRVWGAWKTNPQQNTSVYSYTAVLTANGVEVPDCTAATCVLGYSKRPPNFSSRTWSAAETNYERYDVVFYPGTEDADLFPYRGECYLAEEDADGVQFWQLVEFPAVLRRFVVQAVAADMLRYYGGNDARAGFLEARARAALEDEAQKAGPSVAGAVRVTGVL